MTWQTKGIFSGPIQQENTWPHINKRKWTRICVSVRTLCDSFLPVLSLQKFYVILIHINEYKHFLLRPWARHSASTLHILCLNLLSHFKKIHIKKPKLNFSVTNLHMTPGITKIIVRTTSYYVYFYNKMHIWPGWGSMSWQSQHFRRLSQEADKFECSLGYTVRLGFKNKWIYNTYIHLEIP